MIKFGLCSEVVLKMVNLVPANVQMSVFYIFITVLADDVTWSKAKIDLPLEVY